MAHLSDLLSTLPARRWRPALLAAIYLAAAARFALAEDSAAFEDAVKAAFIYKFAPFVTWPQSSEGQDAFRICSYGTDGVTAALAQVTTGEQVDKHPIVLQPLQSVDQLGTCHILYIANGTASDGVLAAAKTKPVLTITQGPLHGMVQLVMVNHHVRFDVDLDLVKQGGLVISSKLLALAHAVYPAGKEPG